MEQENNSPNSANSSDEVGNWIFSLIPVGVAFLFYVVFILQANLPNTHLFLAYGATAGFIGLESFWIVQGLRNRRSNIVIMGVTGIAITLAVLYLYLSFVS